MKNCFKCDCGTNNPFYKEFESGKVFSNVRKEKTMYLSTKLCRADIEIGNDTKGSVFHVTTLGYVVVTSTTFKWHNTTYASQDETPITKSAADYGTYCLKKQDAFHKPFWASSEAILQCLKRYPRYSLSYRLLESRCLTNVFWIWMFQPYFASVTIWWHYQVGFSYMQLFVFLVLAWNSKCGHLRSERAI